jgi:catechol 2,3-dioxygenase-like lactoylglutathione lyase family enzyme
MTSIHHLYLCLKDFDKTSQFYISMFNILKLEHISTLEEYNLYTYGNDLIHIGIMPVSGPNKDDINDKFRIGMSHIAFKVDTEEQINAVLKLAQSNNLRIESEIELRSHHGLSMPTIIFYCPSGIKIEIVK